MTQKGYKCRFYFMGGYFEQQLSAPLKEFYFFPILNKRCNRTIKFIYHFSVIEKDGIYCCVFRKARKGE